jgi:Domain of unknown function (DUF4159)
VKLKSAALLIVAASCAWGVLHAQRPFKEYRASEYNDFPLPPDYQQKTEWTRARLKYPSIYGAFGGGGFGRRRGGGGDLNWTIDYPRSDRHLLQGVRRLTRIDSRSVEQVVELDGQDDVFNWPMMYAVEVGHWALPDDQAAQLREFLLRGGFLMVDDFHGSEEWGGINEWEVFVESMSKVFPNREIEDLADNDQIFHTIYDLSDRFQVPGAQPWFGRGITYEKGETGHPAHWRAIRDDKGRVMVAICHNMDLGDAWEWSDDPNYPEKFASLAYRIAMNYFTYDLTH